MKSLRLLSMVVGTAFVLSGCRGIHTADKYTVSVAPYTPVNEENVHFGECSISIGDELNISGQGAWPGTDDDILISKGGTYTISGCCDNVCINVSTSDIVKLIFANAVISNPDGYAIVSSSEKLIIGSDGESTLTGNGGTYENAVYSDGSVLIIGDGSMDIDGGIFSRGGIQFGRNVTTLCQILRTEGGDIVPGLLSIT